MHTPDVRPVARLTLENVRCFKRLDLELAPGVTVLLGDNGSGKTTIMEAIASLSAGDDEGLERFPLRRGAEDGLVTLRHPDGSVSASWQARTEARTRLSDDTWLFAYGRYRRVPPPPPPTRSPFDLTPEWAESAYTSPWSDLSTAVFRRRTTSLFRPDNYLLSDLPGLLIQAHERRRDLRGMEVAWKRLEASLRSLQQGFDGLTIRWDEQARRQVARVVRHGVELDIRELSDGYQSVLVVVLDLILRFATLFPFLPDPLGGHAIILVDELDLHLHPRWQREVLDQLTTLLPNAQFVVTTHSPAVVQAAIERRHEVVVLECRRGVSTARRLGARAALGLRHAEVGALWTHERLFGVPRHSVDVDRLETEVSRLTRRFDRGRASAAERRQLLERFDELQAVFVADETRRGAAGLLPQLARAQQAYLRRLEEKLSKVEER